MKLLVILGTLNHMGGAERQALYLVEHLVKHLGSNVEVLAFQDGQVIRHILDSLGVRTYVFPYYFRWPRPKRIGALLRLACFLRFHIRPDGLLPFVGVHSKTAALVWPYSGARFCWWNQQDEGRDLTGTAVERRILQRTPCITSNSIIGQEFLSRTYGLSPARVLIYNNGTPIPQISKPSGVWRAR